MAFPPLGALRVRGSPEIPDVGIIALVPDPFRGAWQPRHQVMTRLANYFHVVWMEPAPSWRSLVFGNRGSEVEQADIGIDPLSSLVVLDPGRRFPRFYRPRALANWTARARGACAVRELRQRGCTRIILYLWRPSFADELDRIPHDISCYHIDDEYSFSSHEQPISPEERRVLERVDQVFIHSPALMDKKGHVNPRTYFVPNGADYASFSNPVPEPPELAAIPHPRVGYVGFLKKQLDWKLLEELARRHPAWSFVFVGPRQVNPEIEGVLDRIESMENVHFLGPRKVSALGAYPQHFDVCILPYEMTGYTHYINPLKLYEYLASGTPVVGVPIRTLQDFREHISLAEGVDSWSRCLADTLDAKPGEAERRMARQALARRYDWDHLVGEVAERLAERLGVEIPSRLSRTSGLVREGSG
jgi:glycosyltransferase involved in cell wall biosynthesis